jgi:hypothetical protein
VGGEAALTPLVIHDYGLMTGIPRAEYTVSPNHELSRPFPFVSRSVWGLNASLAPHALPRIHM